MLCYAVHGCGQVDAFKAKLAAEAELAAAAATADGLTRQAAVAAAKAPADGSEADGKPASLGFLWEMLSLCICRAAPHLLSVRAFRVPHHPAGKAPVLLNTSSCPAPNYWPDTTADATALAQAQALKQAAEQEAAARRAILSEQQLLAAAEARRLEQERQAAATAAAQADKQVKGGPCNWVQWCHPIRRPTVLLKDGASKSCVHSRNLDLTPTVGKGAPAKTTSIVH